MGWQAKVGRHCTYLQLKTVNGNAAYVKRRPAIITAVAAPNVTVRVGHSGETYANVTPRTDPDSNSTGIFVSY